MLTDVMQDTAPPRIVFAGTPDFAVPSLKALLATTGPGGIIGVYTQPDRPAGRGRKLKPSPVKLAAEAAGVTLYQPRTLRTPAAQQELAALSPDLMIVVAYGLLLPQAVLDIPRLGCVNVHASLLPRWRGAAPIQRTLLAGDAETGVTLMQMEAGLDTGPMLAQARLPIGSDMTAAQLHDALSSLGADTLRQHLSALLEKHLTPQPQDERLACYADKLSKQEASMDWRRTAIQLERQVRAFNPWPVAQTTWQGQILRIWQAKALPEPAPISSGPVLPSSVLPGQVIAANREGIAVTTGDGMLQLTRVQLAGKRPQAVADFINAYDLRGQQLGS